MAELTQNRLKELLHYNPETGVFTRKVSRGKTLKGERAGYVNVSGYRIIEIDGKAHREHRLAFLYTEGSMPPDCVDHINRVSTDNRLSNLRKVTHQENMANRKDNAPFVGVGWRDDCSRWQARAKIKGKDVYLGYFKTHIAACYCRHAHDIGV